VLLLAFGGLMTSPIRGRRCFHPAIFVGLHMIEANVLTPLIVGRKLTINPLLILVSLSFWAWVWGTTGALLAVPLLIILKDHLLGCRHARHRWLPVRRRHVDPRRRGRRERRVRVFGLARAG
jgi:predicted PurR-regulated permease PerM